MNCVPIDMLPTQCPLLPTQGPLLPTQCPLLPTQVHCSLHSVHCSLHSVHCSLHRVHCSLHSVHCSLHRVHCSLHRVHCSLHRVQCSLHRVHRSLHRVHCSLHGVHCSLHRVHCSLLPEQGNPLKFTLFRNIHSWICAALRTLNGNIRSLPTGIMEEYPVMSTSQGTYVPTEQTSEAIRVTYRAGGARGLELRTAGLVECVADDSWYEVSAVLFVWYVQYKFCLQTENTSELLWKLRANVNQGKEDSRWRKTRRLSKFTCLLCKTEISSILTKHFNPNLYIFSLCMFDINCILYMTQGEGKEDSWC